MTEARATLKNDAGNTYDMPPNTGENIPDGFNEAYVHQGTWIFYDSSYKNNYSKMIKVVREGSGDVPLGFNAKSAREVDYQSDGIALFEHFNYCGVMKTFVDSATELPGFNSGISSAIILPNSKWDLYTEVGFKGISSQRDVGDYANSKLLGVGNDAVKSIRRA